MAHPLSGADIGTLRTVMGEAGRIDRRGAALAIWAAVLGRLPFTTLECILAGRHLPDAADIPPPVFILGHWRSGTTHLYNLMSLGQFGYVTPIAAGLPWTCSGWAGSCARCWSGNCPNTGSSTFQVIGSECAGTGPDTPPRRRRSGSRPERRLPTR